MQEKRHSDSWSSFSKVHVKCLEELLWGHTLDVPKIGNGLLLYTVLDSLIGYCLWRTLPPLPPFFVMNELSTEKTVRACLPARARACVLEKKYIRNAKRSHHVFIIYMSLYFLFRATYGTIIFYNFHNCRTVFNLWLHCLVPTFFGMI